MPAAADPVQASAGSRSPRACRLEGRSLPSAAAAAAVAATCWCAFQAAPDEPSCRLRPSLLNSSDISAPAASTAAWLAVELAEACQGPPLSRSCRLAPRAPGAAACQGWEPAAQLAPAVSERLPGCPAEPSAAAAAAATAVCWRADACIAGRTPARSASPGAAPASPAPWRPRV